MSTFAVTPVKIFIEPHTNADALELARVGDYRAVVKKGQYRDGQYVLYVPEAAIVPDSILKAYNFWNTEKNIGMLAGPKGNRVKAIKLRGELSQGIILPLDMLDCDDTKLFFTLPTEDGIGTMVVVDDLEKDYAPDLDITKWEPPVPVHLAGEMFNAGTNITVNYDIENIKAWPDVIKDGEEVIMTEKIHGTFCGVAWVPPEDRNENMVDGKFVVFSKGLGAKGLCFKDNERNKDNVYLRAIRSNRVLDLLEEMGKNYSHIPIFVFGEVYGRGVQDLTYGTKDIQFRVFDICIGYRGNQQYFNYDFVKPMCNLYNIEMVPLIYRGPFSKEVLKQMTTGREAVSGTEANIREGVVVKPITEDIDIKLGRVILKSVSEDYLLRKGGTEFN